MNRKKRTKIIFVFVIILIILTGSALYFKYKPSIINPPSSPDYCSQDSDCVPSSCCHPDSCTLKINEPQCNKVACTMSCEPKTLDCGQGSCTCVNNKCLAEITG